MEQNLILIAIFVGFVFLLLCSIWPTIGLMAFLGMYLFKIYLRVLIPALIGFWGYLLDVGLLLAALIGFSLYSLRVSGERRKLVPYYVWIIFIFLFLWTWFRYPASRDPDLAWIKSLVFSIFSLLTIVLGIVWGRSELGTGKIVKSLVLMGVISFFGVVIFGRAYSGSESESARITIGGAASPLAPADFAAYLFLVAVIYWVAKQNFLYTFLAAVCLPASVVTILLTGTRGPLVAVPVLLLLIFYFYRRQVNFRLGVYLSILVFVVYLAIVAVGEMRVVQARFGTEGLTAGFEARILMIRFTLKGWLENPFFGMGPGDTRYQFGFEFPHPHNVLLEVLNELGIVGFIPFAVLGYLGLRTFKYLRAEFFDGTTAKIHSVIIFICFFYNLVLSFKTGSYAGGNMSYFFLGALISQGEYLRQLTYQACIGEFDQGDLEC